MLVLSRKAGECVSIGDDVTLEVRKISGNRVTIAFRAPKDVRILRGELAHAVKEFEPTVLIKESTGSDTEEVANSKSPEQDSVVQYTLSFDTAAAI